MGYMHKKYDEGYDLAYYDAYVKDRWESSFDEVDLIDEMYLKEERVLLFLSEYGVDPTPETMDFAFKTLNGEE